MPQCVISGEFLLNVGFANFSVVVFGGFAVVFNVNCFVIVVRNIWLPCALSFAISLCVVSGIIIFDIGQCRKKCFFFFIDISRQNAIKFGYVDVVRAVLLVFFSRLRLVFKEK